MPSTMEDSTEEKREADLETEALSPTVSAKVHAKILQKQFFFCSYVYMGNFMGLPSSRTEVAVPIIRRLQVQIPLLK